MSTTQQVIKVVVARWPEPFWKIVTKALIDRGTNMQSYLTELVAKDMALPVPGAEEAEVADDAA